MKSHVVRRGVLLAVHTGNPDVFIRTSLKHLTFKTVFLLALGSGEHRSEIHAWLHKNIRHQSDWSKYPCALHPAFYPRVSWLRRAQIVWPQCSYQPWPPTLDKSLKGDRSLCPVRALRYYLDRTSDLRQNKELVFVSFKKGFDKDISPATISSWIKQTVILCLSSLIRRPLHCIRLKPMMSGPLLLLRPSSRGSP